MDGVRQSCLASQDAFLTNDQCLEFCFQIGKFNENMSKVWIHPFITFVDLANDFFGDQKILKSLMSPHEESTSHTPKEEEIIEDPKEIIRKDVELLSFNYFLDPLNQDSRDLNLNNVRFETRKGDGWNLNEVRVKEYPRQDSAWTFAVVFNMIAMMLFLLK